ncbi:MAG: amidophosphoribosyltransferase [Candidatus Micrarchaeales archaeon]|nr:amidophosphoribosyltransferase [Candidatus Micrarchaeales archaeon]
MCGDSDTPKEHCGVVAVATAKEDAMPYIHNGLVAEQHRGQDSFGIALLDKKGFHVEIKMGLVSELPALKGIDGRFGIGHVRYTTAGVPNIKDSQPNKARCRGLEIVTAFNGNVANVMRLKEKLRREYSFAGNGDGEVIATLIASYLDKGMDLESAIVTAQRDIDGAYSVVLLTSRGKLAAFRDPHGLRPLSFGRKGSSIMFASESVALDANGFTSIESVRPGELITVSNGNVTRRQMAAGKPTAHCMFEFVYFSRPDSVLEGQSVYNARFRLGIELAKTCSTDADIIVPVPDTARPAAEGMHEVTGIPVREGLMKNRYIGRTFILPSQGERERAVKIKLNPIPAVVSGKKIVLVDDSLVRGTTLRNLVSELRRAGARKVEVWLTCPPIISPCFYGIDMSNHNELAAAKMSVDEIEAQIGADALRYQTIDGLKKALGLGNDICTGCLTAKYPTKLANMLAKELSKSDIKGRYFEQKSLAESKA